MGRRRRARELAFLALYQSDLLGESAAARLGELLAEGARPSDLVEFARLVVESFDRHRPAVDRAIRETSPRWDLERMPAPDRAILRLGVVELLLVPGVPEPATIDEAVELAKRYGGEESWRFVNGVLDAVRRRVAAGGGEAGGPGEAEGERVEAAEADGGGVVESRAAKPSEG